MVRRMGSIPGESPYDSVFGHTLENYATTEESVLDDTMSDVFIQNCKALGRLTLPPPTDYDPLFDGPNKDAFINQSTKVEGDQQ
jgi:hypothetical protein